MLASLCFLIIIIDVKNLLLRSITFTAKSSKENERRQVNEKFYKLERVYRDCLKMTGDKTRILQYTA